VIKYYDKLGREILAKTVNVKGDSVFVNTVYNTKGQISYVTLPYFKGQSNSAKKIVTYDNYGRITAERSPGACMKYTYNGKTVTILDSIKNITITREMDNSGTLIKSTDVGDITYSYYANKQVKQINCLGLSTTLEYDAFGRQTKLVDPNAGTIKYGYNPYGQLIKQIDALDRTMSLAYDTLGRIKTRNEMTFNTTWTYNTNTTLTRVQGSHGVTQKYSYDSYMRPKSVTDSINSLQLTTSCDYDSNGRISKITYPSGFSVTYHYQNGYLKEIKRGDNSASIWKIDTLNAWGQVTDETFGNSVKSERTYDANGYLTLIKTGTNGNIQNLEYIYNSKGQLYQRKDHRHGSITETFEYDNMDRITSSVINGNTVSVAYGNNGNINTKSDLGVYTYNQQHPHAVEYVTCYDTSNHYTMQDISYTSFNMASQITQGDSTLVFTYGPDYARKKTVTTIEGAVTTRYYSGNYEKIVTSSSTKELHYITANGRIVAIAQKVGGTTTLYYVHTDNLGSVNCITNSTPSIVQETSFSAWGRRRDPVTWEVLDTTPTNLITSRGYTGHEHIDEFNLINMNGRIYDPILCRFLSPDPYIANAGFTQDYNRYSYVLNNPLSYIDPTGFKVAKYLEMLSFTPIIGLSEFSGGGCSNWWEAYFYAKSRGYNKDIISFLHELDDGITSSTFDGTVTVSYVSYNYTVVVSVPGTKMEDGVVCTATKVPVTSSITIKIAFDGVGGFAASGVGELLPPVDTKYPITSPYTEGNRVIPELGINRPHLAIDIGTPVGTPIRSPWSGKVIMAQDTKYGLSVIIKHDYLYNGQYIQTGYAHLYEMNVTDGLIINRGTIIGYTGIWGTGPHLHFTLRIGDQKVNPTILFPYK